MQIPVPPELAGPVYGWIRRLALQADLAGADRVLRDALADLTSSLAVAIIYPGEDGLWTLGNDEEIPKDAKPLVAVAQARRALIASHTAIVPIVTSSETVAVIVLTRNPRNPGYQPVEQVAMIALARESASILHHLAVQHLQKSAEIEADKGGLYRADALEAHRTRGNEGVPMQLTPGWVRRAYPILIVAIVTALLASILIKVPTYSTGRGVIVIKGETHTAPVQGTVQEVLVKPGQEVKKGAPLVRLYSSAEEEEYKAAKSDADNATIQYLQDREDDQTKRTLIATLTRVAPLKARVEARTVRAQKDGTIYDLRAQPGQNMMPGDAILTLVEKGAEPEIYALLPAKDRPRLRTGKQKVQIQIDGFTKTREHATITFVNASALGGSDLLKQLGPVAEPLKLQGGSFVLVKAKLPRTFKTQQRTNYYHHGMTATTEVKIVEKPFLATLIPGLEKYMPD